MRGETPLLVVRDKNYLQDNLTEIVRNLAAITAKATGFDESELLSEQEDTVRKWDFFIEATVSDTVQAYGGYEVHSLPGLGIILYESAKMTQAQFQGRGYGKTITTKALQQTPGLKYFGFSTQNPAEILSTKRAIPGMNLIPLDGDYTPGTEIYEAFEATLEKRNVTDIDLSTGIKRIYDRRFGNYTVDISHPEIASIETRLQKLGLKRDEGDFVYLTGKLAGIS